MFLILWTLLAGDQSVGVTPAKRSPLVSTVETAEYFSETYARRGQGSPPVLLFFVGEAVKVKVAIGNPTRDAQILTFTQIVGHDMFTMEASRDGVSVELRSTFDHGTWKDANGSTVPFNPASPTRLGRFERIEWLVDLGTSLEPGRYHLRVVPNAADGSGLPISPRVSTYAFDVRPRSEDAEAEITRREAWRHYLEGGESAFKRAELAVDRLLQIHPNSYEAFVVRGRVAMARGDEARAIEAYARAAEIVRNNRDTLLVRFSSRAHRESMQKDLDALLRKQ
jgi:hypothetical protein